VERFVRKGDQHEAIEQLKNEHKGIKMIFHVLRKMCESLKFEQTLDTDHFEGILEFPQIFVDKCHHGKEEDLLFPAISGGVSDCFRIRIEDLRKMIFKI
jgi:hemerythrin-like domain-containing protein